MGFIKRIFQRAAETARNFDSAVCEFMGTNESCSLVQQLKDKQAEKREIDNKVKAFEQGEPVALDKFIELLLRLEKASFEMGMDYRPYHKPGVYNSRIKDTFNGYYGIQRFEGIIDQVPDTDIDAIYIELKAMKNRASVLSGLRQQSSVLAEEIEKVKDQLGIE